MSGVQLSIQSDFSIMSGSVVNPIRFQYYVWFRCLSNQISALCLVPLSIQSDFSIMSGSVVYPIRLQHLVWFRCLSNQISALCLVSLSIQSDFSIMYGLYCTVLLEHPAYNVRIIWCNDFGFGWNNWWWYVNLNPFLPPPLIHPILSIRILKGVVNGMFWISVIFLFVFASSDILELKEDTVLKVYIHF